MVHTIDIKNEKYLVTKQVVFMSIDNAFQMGTSVNTFATKLKAYRLSVTGPPIIRGRVDFNGGEVLIKKDIMLQFVGNPVTLPKEFEWKEHLKIGPCVYARFRGREENLIFASQKISVYAYENEIELKKESYTVYVEKTNVAVTIDIFIPHED
ncbi:hypothetical protein Mpt1_c11690 [Candidatus Methanoplasma termitum]|uniref:Uncharacterized protein n=1 Tax=Candidatus Methanoplasma termitum TaxID=1577791 RepID=A0A0A7LHP9_9ARCH|nr:hypothetical protein [Candidatus Methanoplasma termitum]AIZ57031.1 hypothetical protein Mpt1_c11690 [Candidatus Methanoplasma termitum]